jgi:single-strand DNA-binding protein
MNYNRVVLIGRLTRDPELKYTPKGTAVASFSLAINRKFNREETDFIDVVAWQQQAEYCANYGSKGRLMMVEGRIQVRSYENQEGQKRKATEVVADDLKFLDKQGTSQGNHPAPPTTNKKESNDWDDLGREVRLEDIDMIDKPDEDDIPF